MAPRSPKRRQGRQAALGSQGGTRRPRYPRPPPVRPTARPPFLPSAHMPFSITPRVSLFSLYFSFPHQVSLLGFSLPRRLFAHLIGSVIVVSTLTHFLPCGPFCFNISFHNVSQKPIGPLGFIFIVKLEICYVILGLIWYFIILCICLYLPEGAL